MCTLDDLMNLLKYLEGIRTGPVVKYILQCLQNFCGQFNYGNIMLCSFCMKYLPT